MSKTQEIITGQEFNERFNNIHVIFYNKQKNIKQGLNKISTNFNPTEPLWKLNGYEFYDLQQINYSPYNSFRNHLGKLYYSQIKIPNDAQVYIYKNYYRTNSIFIVKEKDTTKLHLYEKCTWIKHISTENNVIDIFSYILFPELDTYDKCIDVLEQTPELIFVIPENLKTPKMYDIIVKSLDNNIDNIQYLSKKYKTKEICQKAMDDNIQNIKYIPNEYKNDELCKKIVEYDESHAYNYYDDVNKKYIGREHEYLIQHLPHDFITQEICDKLFEKDYHVVKYIPKKMITQNMKDKLLQINEKYYTKYFSKTK